MQAKAYERGRFRQCGVPVVRFCFFSDPGGNYWSVQQPTDQKSTETVDTIDNTSLPGGGPHFAADPGVGPTAAAVSDASIVFGDQCADHRAQAVLGAGRIEAHPSLRVRQGDT